MSQGVLSQFTENALPLLQNGRWPGAYPQWRVPGANARPVMRHGVAAIAEQTGEYTVVEYTVPQGMRFVFTGLVWNFLGSGWIEGSNELVLDMLIVGPSGTRTVQYLNNLTFQIGSRTDGPFPVPALVQLNNSNILRARMTQNDINLVGNNNLVMIHGYEFPESEAAF